jgi:predicted nucleotidyltransferase
VLLEDETEVLMRNEELLEELFEVLIKDVEPTRSQKDDAQRTHTTLRSRLESGNMGLRIIDAYLSGSYARKTAIAPLDDVDIIFLIDPSMWKRGFFTDKPTPSTVLTTFERAIRYRYPDSRVQRQRRSVGLKLHKMDIDAVPAIPDDSSSDRIFVLDSGSEEWIPSAPKVHGDNTTRVNKLREGRFVPLVKVLKFWNRNHPSAASLKSFAIETIAVRLFSEVNFSSFTQGALLFFDFLAHFAGEAQEAWGSDFGIKLSPGAWTYTVPDVADTGSNIVAGLEKELLVKFLKRATSSRNRLLEALKARTPERCKNRFEAAFRLYL